MLRIAWVLARTDLKQRYMGSALGMLWTLIRPLALYAVLYIVFTNIVRVGGQVKNYPIYLLMAFTLWGFFADLTSNSVSALVRREPILRKIQIPMLSVTIDNLITASVQLGASLIVFMIFTLLSGLTPTVAWLTLVPAVALIMAFAFGVGLTLAVTYVYFRDVEPLWEVAAQVLFWATPIIYVATFPPEWLRNLIGLNPLAQIFTELRATIVDPTAPHFWEVFSTLSIIGSAVVLLTSVGLGWFLFSRHASRVIERL
jgi:ABC-2 type transport system permease protein